MAWWSFGKRRNAGRERTGGSSNNTTNPQAHPPLARAGTLTRAYMEGIACHDADFVRERRSVELERNLHGFGRAESRSSDKKPQTQAPTMTREQAIKEARGKTIHPNALPPPSPKPPQTATSKAWDSFRTHLPNLNQLKHPTQWQAYRRGPKEEDEEEEEGVSDYQFQPSYLPPHLRNWVNDDGTPRLIGKQITRGDRIGNDEVDPDDSVSVHANDSDEDPENDLSREPEVINHPTEDVQDPVEQTSGPLSVIPVSPPLDLDGWHVGAVSIEEQNQPEPEPEPEDQPEESPQDQQHVEELPEDSESDDELGDFQAGFANALNPDPTQPPFSHLTENGQSRVWYIIETLRMPEDSTYFDVQDYLARNVELIRHAHERTVPWIDDLNLREHGQVYERKAKKGKLRRMSKKLFRAINEVYWDSQDVNMALELPQLAARSGDARWFYTHGTKKAFNGRLPLESHRRRLAEDTMYEFEAAAAHATKTNFRMRRPNSLLSNLVAQAQEIESGRSSPSSLHGKAEEHTKSIYCQDGTEEDEHDETLKYIRTLFSDERQAHGTDEVKSGEEQDGASSECDSGDFEYDEYESDDEKFDEDQHDDIRWNRFERIER